MLTMPLAPGYRGALLVLAGTLCFSFGGVGVKLCGFGPWQLSLLRSLAAGAVLLIFLPAARRRWTLGVWLTGLCLGATATCFILSTKYTTAANAIFLQSSAPLWIMLLTPVLLKDPVRRRELASVPVFLVGLGLIALGPTVATELSPRVNLGNGLALASGLMYALAIIGMRALAGRGAEAALVCGNALAVGVALAVLAASSGPDAQWISGSALDWTTVLLLGTVQIGLGYILYARGLRYITAVRASLIGLLEPVLNPLWVLLVFPIDRPGPTAIVGAVLVLAATAYQVLAPAGRGGRPAPGA